MEPNIILTKVIFYVFSTLLIISGISVIVTRNPVKSALFLVVAFFASSVLWMLIDNEFLALVLVLVYVGAVMTLFLFVVMMLNVHQTITSEGFVRYLPWGVMVAALMVGLLIYAMGPEQFGLKNYQAVHHAADYSNVGALGMVLYTTYAYPFELAAVLLLIAIVAGISLAFRGGRPDAKRQVVVEQLTVAPSDRLKLVKMEPQKYKGVMDSDNEEQS